MTLGNSVSFATVAGPSSGSAGGSATVCDDDGFELVEDGAVVGRVGVGAVGSFAVPWATVLGCGSARDGVVTTRGGGGAMPRLRGPIRSGGVACRSGLIPSEKLCSSRGPTVSVGATVAGALPPLAGATCAAAGDAANIASTPAPRRAFRPNPIIFTAFVR